MNWMLVFQEIQYSCVETQLHYKYSSRAYEVISLLLRGVSLGDVTAKNYIKNSHIHKTYERLLNTQNNLLKRDHLTHQIRPKPKLLVSFICFFPPPKQVLSQFSIAQIFPIHAKIPLGADMYTGI